MGNSFRDIIGFWPTPEVLAHEIGAGVWAVRKWKTRDNIPPEWWLEVIAAATRRDRHLTAFDLARIAARQREAAQ
jgi:hypothetical protein